MAKIDLGTVHADCGCKEYNHGRCYNCLNGFHSGCRGRCRRKNAKVLGLAIRVEPRRQPRKKAGRKAK
jgi:hypothetical protein